MNVTGEFALARSGPPMNNGESFKTMPKWLPPSFARRILETKCRRHFDEPSLTRGSPGPNVLAFLAQTHPNLAAVAEAWPTLPEPINAGILAMIGTATLWMNRRALMGGLETLRSRLGQDSTRS